MPATAPTVLATNTGFVSRGRGPYDWAPGPVFDLAVELVWQPDRPRICHLGTATGDDPARIAGFYGAFAGRVAVLARGRHHRLLRPRAPPGRRRAGPPPWSNSVHHDSEPQRRPLFRQLVAAGTLPAGHATDDGGPGLPGHPARRGGR